MKNTLKKIATLATVSTVLLSTACKKNSDTNNADLTLQFQTQVDGNNFGMDDTYQSHNDVTIQYESFQFYLSDITFVNSDGEDRLISEIELFRFDQAGYSALDFRAPSGKYDKVKFGIGVKKSLNEADPSNYNSEDHPLSTLQNTYWGWATAYRFVMAEGRYDAEGDGDYEGIFAFHTGREISYRTQEIEYSFEIDKKEENVLRFDIDLEQLFDRAGNEVNVPETPFYHGGTDNEELAVKLSDNMATAIKINE